MRWVKGRTSTADRRDDEQMPDAGQVQSSPLSRHGRVGSTTSSNDPRPRHLLVVNPSPDLYGADLQMLQAVVAAIERGWRVTVALPHDGPLAPRIRAVGAEVAFARYPVLRKTNLHPKRLLRMLMEAAAALPRCLSLIRALGADVVLVNTATLPWWLLAVRLARRPAIGYLHEAETGGSRIVRCGLVAPLQLARSIIVISESALTAMTDVAPWLKQRAVLIYNGVPGPAGHGVLPLPEGGPLRLAVVGRLSPRKGTDVALRAVSLLRQQGIDAVLEVAGDSFAGYEWFERQLRDIADEPALAGSVKFSGYCSPVWPVLQRAHVVLAPSLNEPFGNAVVEAQLAGRVVVAAAAQGHLESVVQGETGVLVPPGDSASMALAVVGLLSEPARASHIAVRAQLEAERRFSLLRYGAEVGQVLQSCLT